MFGRKRDKDVLYKIPERERGHLEAFAVQRAVANANYLGILKGIVEREKLSPDSIFDTTRGVFIKPK